MFFQSSKSLFVGIVLMPIASYQLFWGWAYADAAKREVSTVGILTSVTSGRGYTYDYAFAVNGVRELDYSSVCRTPLSARGCEEDSPVLVYYDPHDPSTSALEELGAAGRGKLFFGSSTGVCGLILIGLYSFPHKRKTDGEESEEPDENESGNKSDVLHLFPASDSEVSKSVDA